MKFDTHQDNITVIDDSFQLEVSIDNSRLTGEVVTFGAWVKTVNSAWAWHETTMKVKPDQTVFKLPIKLDKSFSTGNQHIFTPSSR